MAGEIGAAGDIATGLVWAHAADDAEAVGGHGDAGAKCLNCGTVLTGAYCHACGQSAHVHKTLASIGHDLAHGAFHFEGRIFRALPMLVRDPGGLTRRYIAGERQRFVAPLPLFLFAVFLMFAVIHALGGGELDETMLAAPHARPPDQIARIDAEMARQRAMIAQAEARPAGDEDRSKSIAAERAALTTLIAARRVMSRDETTSLLADIPDNVTGWPRIDRGIARARDNPGLAFYEFQTSAYKYSWALIPLSTPFVALLFLWRRRFTLYDHAIFVTYSLDFMLLLATLLTLEIAAGLPSGVAGVLILVVPPIHLLLQLRGAYRLRWFSAAWRTVALLVFAWVALTAFVLLLLALGLMG
ncbi:DUF3667 domain-containing protein [uncultured Sphingomonas sp.]|uniref:DUF3667 domain-containing protein n=1 Tax=uncultured Sphingomonas sp. TaxID=158754 RepID=UPI0035CB2B42